jgi:hypothetical protein
MVNRQKMYNLQRENITTWRKCVLYSMLYYIPLLSMKLKEMFKKWCTKTRPLEMNLLLLRTP